jgi:hypothetical protein
MRKSKIHFLTMVAGLLLAAAVVCSNVFAPASRHSHKPETKTETSGDQKESISLNVAPTSTPPGSLNVELKTEAHCLFDICSNVFRPDQLLPEFEIHSQRLLLTLFRVIIAPNAP